jgi:hypothetical protein
MKAIEFPEVNVRIAENQPEYETIPANIRQHEDTNLYEVAMCLRLDEEERKQVAETGRIWLTILQPTGNFNPIKTSFLKPDYLTECCYCTPDETTGWTEFDGMMKCNICGKQVSPEIVNMVLIPSCEEQKEWEAMNRKPAE